jgi:hypothetical protein
MPGADHAATLTSLGSPLERVARDRGILLGAQGEPDRWVLARYDPVRAGVVEVRRLIALMERADLGTVRRVLAVGRWLAEGKAVRKGTTRSGRKPARGAYPRRVVSSASGSSPCSGLPESLAEAGHDLRAEVQATVAHDSRDRFGVGDEPPFLCDDQQRQGPRDMQTRLPGERARGAIVGDEGS